MVQPPIGPYLIEQPLAAGGMAEVFIAKRVGPHGFTKRVAFKRILPQYARDHDFVAMFIDEARLAARLDHPNIVQVFDFGEADGELFLAMELVDGTNVHRLLQAIAVRKETVPLDVALHMASQAAHALSHAHRACDDRGNPLKFVHRDVSPSNLLITRTGHVKLTDFGIARVAGRDRRTHRGHVRGKLGYMSPEQVMGEVLDGRSDVFTLATVLAELLLAEPLFGEGREISILTRIRDVNLAALEQRMERLPHDVHRLLMGALSQRPTSRPDSDAFADACDEIMRRRGMAHGAERLARLIARLELVEPLPGHEGESTAAPEGRIASHALEPSTGTEHVLERVGQGPPRIYRVRKADGTGTDPISYPELITELTSGRADGLTLVSREGGDYAPASALPELERFTASRGLTWDPVELERATRGGDLDHGRLLRVAYELGAERATGVLHLRADDRRKKIYFVDGRPDFVASSDPGERLGAFLVRRGVCSEVELDMALALLPRYGGRLGDALVGLGVIRPLALFSSLCEQVEERTLEAFGWPSGRWSFAPGFLCEEETLPIGRDPNVLLRDAALWLDEGEVRAALRSLAGRRLLPVVEPRARGAVYHLPEAWERVLEELRENGGRVLREEPWGADECRAIHFGLACGLLRVEP